MTTYIDEEIKKFKQNEIEDMLYYNDVINTFKDIAAQYVNNSTIDRRSAIEDFRAEEIEFEISHIEGVENDIGYFTDRFHTEDIIEYLLSKYSESEINEKLEELESEYTVADIKELIANNDSDGVLESDLSKILYFDFTEHDYLDRNNYNLMDQILQEYSYKVCEVLGLY